MYAGRVVETAEAATLFDQMHHPYTQALLASIPQLDQDTRKALHAIPGLPPDLTHPPQGCRFAARCPRASDKCRTEEPPLAGKTFDHRFACWHPVDGPLVLTMIGEGGPDAAEHRAGRPGRRRAWPRRRPVTRSATSADARSRDGGSPGHAGHRRQEPADKSEPVVVAAGLEVTADGRLEVTERAVEVTAGTGTASPRCSSSATW